MMTGPTIKAPREMTERSLAWDSIGTTIGLEGFGGVVVDILIFCSSSGVQIRSPGAIRSTADRGLLNVDVQNVPII